MKNIPDCSTIRINFPLFSTAPWGQPDLEDACGEGPGWTRCPDHRRARVQALSSQYHRGPRRGGKSRTEVNGFCLQRFLFAAVATVGAVVTLLNQHLMHMQASGSLECPPRYSLIFKAIVTLLHGCTEYIQSRCHIYSNDHEVSEAY